jgi:hypothetical protein
MPPAVRRVQKFLSNLARMASRGGIALLALLLSIGKRLGIAVLLLLLSMAALEVTLRALHPYILPVKISNEIATGYRLGWDGIYQWRSDLDSMFMKPKFHRQMWFNGYQWEHQTDELGFRNPETYEQADIVLLGDSMIYGHGAEEQDTVRYYLARDLSMTVANLGMQGAAIHNEYQILRHYGLSLDPRFVVVFFLANDVSTDLQTYLTDDEMLRFIQSPPDQLEVDYFEPVQRTDADRLLDDLKSFYSVRALDILRRLLGIGVPDASAARIHRWTQRESLAMLFNGEALKRMDAMAAQQGAQLLHVFVYTGGTYYRGEDAYEESLRNVCRRNGIGWLSLREAMQSVRDRGLDPFLPGDGHFSAAGAKAAAAAVAEWIRSRETGLDGLAPDNPEQTRERTFSPLH